MLMCYQRNNNEILLQENKYLKLNYIIRISFNDNFLLIHFNKFEDYYYTKKKKNK